VAYEIRTEIVIRATAERVWSILTDLASYPSWNPFVGEIAGELRVGGRLSVRLLNATGRTFTFRPRVVRVAPGEELRWLGRFGLPWLFDGEHSFSIAPAPGGITFRHAEVFRGLLVPFLRRSLERGTRPMFLRMNEALRSRSEVEPG
jgi:hypothetical protein